MKVKEKIKISEGVKMKMEFSGGAKKIVKLSCQFVKNQYLDTKIDKPRAIANL